MWRCPARLGAPARDAAKLASERGIRIYTVGFGQAEQAQRGHDQDADVRMDERALKDIAAQTRGEYFHAATAYELKNIYRRLDGRVVRKGQVLRFRRCWQRRRRSS